MTPEDKLAALGHALSAPPAPAANYVPVTRAGNQLFVSGQISTGPDGLVKGHLGRELDTGAGQKAAALCAVNILAQIKFSAGVDLSKVRLLKLTVLVASVPDFSEQHLVANGASNLFVEVLGEAGRHARAAFGVAALPLGAAVEIEAVAEIRE
ncbi:MAG: RidA family protein [Alphaproteobacteria bacterium]|nr:RidA family protein [Alphaproteobacteria bacterium]